jgi:nucleoside 2-deoxyribosyltransferase
MKTLISYSGTRSKIVAEALRLLLQRSIPKIEVLLPGTDIALRDSWRKSISSNLKTIDVAIIVVTQENIERAWVTYEVGYITAHQKRIVPFLFDVPTSRLSFPLASFLAVTSNKDSIFRLITQLALEAKLNVDTKNIEKSFDAAWREFENSLVEARSKSGPLENIVSAVSTSNIAVGGDMQISVLPQDSAKVISSEQAFERIEVAARQNLTNLNKILTKHEKDQHSSFGSLTSVPLKPPVNIDDFRHWVMGKRAAVEPEPVKWAFSRRA